MMDMDPLALALPQMIVAEVEAEAAARERAASARRLELATRAWRPSGRRVRRP